MPLQLADSAALRLQGILQVPAERLSRRAVETAVDVISVEAGTGPPVELTLLAAGQGWPWEVRRALDRLPSFPDGVVVARRFSAGALKLLEAAGANWIDDTGDVNLRLPGLVVRTSGSPPAPARDAGSIRWNDTAVAVGEALLARVAPQVDLLAPLLEVDRSTVSRVLQRFDRAGFTAREARSQGGYHRVTRAPRTLLDAWAAPAAAQPSRTWQATRPTADVLAYFRTAVAPVLEQAGNAALTGAGAADLVAPYLTTVGRIEAYVDARFLAVSELALRDAGLTPVDRGGRFVFRQAPRGVLSLARPLEDLRLASNARIYADLAAAGGRSEEAAEHLRVVTHLGE